MMEILATVLGVCFVALVMLSLCLSLIHILSIAKRIS